MANTLPKTHNLNSNSGNRSQQYQVAISIARYRSENDPTGGSGLAAT
jgi:hypothetical protein